MQNLRRGHYELAVDVLPATRVSAAFADLTLAICPRTRRRFNMSVDPTTQQRRHERRSFHPETSTTTRRSRAHPDYTLNCEEPDYCDVGGKTTDKEHIAYVNQLKELLVL